MMASPGSQIAALLCDLRESPHKGLPLSFIMEVYPKQCRQIRSYISTEELVIEKHSSLWGDEYVFGGSIIANCEFPFCTCISENCSSAICLHILHAFFLSTGQVNGSVHNAR